LPTRFDSWVYKIVAQTIPLMTTAERPEALWQPILNLGAPAHHWVEYFFWDWSTDGSRSSASPSDFVRIWREMILYALEHPLWDPDTNLQHYLDNLRKHEIAAAIVGPENLRKHEIAAAIERARAARSEGTELDRAAHSASAEISPERHLRAAPCGSSQCAHRTGK
jgi:hypothetical protein